MSKVSDLARARVEAADAATANTYVVYMVAKNDARDADAINDAAWLEYQWADRLKEATAATERTALEAHKAAKIASEAEKALAALQEKRP